MNFEEQALRKLEAQEFKQMNGQILRILNLVGARKYHLDVIAPLLLNDGNSQEDLMKSITYLHNSGYIKIENADKSVPLVDAIKPLTSRAFISLTPDGQKLLMGITQDDAIVV